MEAENFSSRTAGGNGRTFNEVAAGTNTVLAGEPEFGFLPPSGSYANPSGNYMQILPDEDGGGDNNNTSTPFGAVHDSANTPYLDFTVRIGAGQTGDYRLWLRISGYDGNSDSMYATLVEQQDGSGGVPDWYC